MSWTVPIVFTAVLAADDPAALRDRISRNMESTEAKLKARDPGDETRRLQQQILDDIDKLLDQNSPQPPPPSGGGGGGSPPNSPPPPSGGGGGGSPPNSPPPEGGAGAASPGGGHTPASRRQQRRQQRESARADKPPPPMPAGSSASPPEDPRRTGPATAGDPRDARPLPPAGSDHFADVVKDVWGHLPEAMRQEADHYYRERFMPRYRDMVREYYKRVSERDRPNSERR